MTAVRVLNLSLLGRATSGVLSQLESEHSASKDLSALVPGLVWTTVALVCEKGGKPLPAFCRRTPWPFKRLRWATLYLWWTILRAKDDYDIILIRYPMGDVFSWIFAPFVRTLVTIHHTKEIEELLVLGSNLRFRVMLGVEKKLQRHAYRHRLGLLGVTEEIRDYEVQRSHGVGHSSVLPNGIDINKVPVLPDHRGDRLELAFISSQFYPWQGLDLLLVSIGESLRKPLNSLPVLHLVGELEKEQLEAVEGLNSRGAQIKVHGLMDKASMEEVLASCHIGIGSLALERKGLSEASTLKVREYLAYGLPVYATHRDAGLPLDFPYFAPDTSYSYGHLVQFAELNRATSRAAVRNLSAPHISKVEILGRVAAEMQAWL